MPEAARFVADTNVLVSRLLFRQSQPALALRKAMSDLRLIVSAETMIELGTVLSRPKFDRYLSAADRLEFFDRLRRLAIHIPNVPPVTACRDPKDDKFLALALAGRATLILTGDDDLLTLHPFRNIPILSPRQYLNLESDPPTRCNRMGQQPALWQASRLLWRLWSFRQSKRKLRLQLNDAPDVEPLEFQRFVKIGDTLYPDNTFVPEAGTE